MTDMRVLGLRLHTMSTPELNLPDALALAGRLGASGVEVIIDDDYPCGLPIQGDAKSLAGIRMLSLEHGAPVVALSSYTKDIDHPDKRVRLRCVEELRRAVWMAKTTGAGSVRVLAGSSVDSSQPDDRAVRIDRATESLQTLGCHAEDAGIALNVENHMNTLATSAKRTRELVERVNHTSVGILFDPANLRILDAEPPDLSVPEQAPWIRALHLKDYTYARAGTERSPREPGLGDVDWSATFSALHRAGISVPATFEYERRWFPNLPPVADVFGRAASFLTTEVGIAMGEVHRETAP